VATIQTPSTSKVLFFGTLGVYSYAVLSNLLKRGVRIASVIIPGAEPYQMPDTVTNIPIIKQPAFTTIETLAIENHIPLHYVLDIADNQLLDALKEYQADFILLACFPYKVPEKIRLLPKKECVNIHPSLLPAYRGPHPIFWQLKAGEKRMGVSLHRATDELDAGDIILQAEVQITAGMRGRAIEAKLGEYGAIVFTEVLRLYQVNNITLKAQNNSLASYMSVPKHQDFTLSPQWTARQAFSFIRGTDEWGRSYHIEIGGSTVMIKTAMAYSPSASLTKSYELKDNYITVQFSPGLITAYIDSITPKTETK